MLIKEFVEKEKSRLADEISVSGKVPHLVIIQVGQNPASCSYVRGKLRDCAEVGIKAEHIQLSEDISEEELLSLVDKYNKDLSINGLIVQLPLPKHISEAKVKLAVEPRLDVDGFHPMTAFSPCTAKGLIDYLEKIGFPFQGANAIVIGRSDIVGKPTAKLLLQHNCNVTILHSKTKKEDMAFYIAHADLIVVAVGREGFLNNDFQYKETAYVVDVGINRGDDGKLHGDAVMNLPVKLQTPVPGGVGLLTRLALLENLLIATK